MSAVVSDETVEEFLKSAGPLLYLNEEANSLMLGICQGLTALPLGKGTQLLRIVDSGKTLLAAIQTPPHNLIISLGSLKNIPLLADFLIAQKISIPGVVGPEKEAELFAEVWRKKASQQCSLGMDQKIYRIDRVNIPAVEGTLKLATLDYVQEVGAWLFKFGQESLPEREKPTFEESMNEAFKAIKAQTAYLWMRDDGPVSVAHLGRPTNRGISIRAVYTPEEHRKSGFGSAIVAHLSKTQIDSGKNFCVLYTDSSNATSNKIYSQIGYTLVIRSKHFIFS